MVLFLLLSIKDQGSVVLGCISTALGGRFRPDWVDGFAKDACSQWERKVACKQVTSDKA